MNALKVTHIPVDDLNLALYMRETEEAKKFSFIKNPLSHTLVKNNILYVYLRETRTIALTPIFFGKFSLLYEPMEEWAVKDLTWNGLPILELAPKVVSLTQPRVDINGKRMVDGIAPNSSKATSSIARSQSGGRPAMPNALLALVREPFKPTCKEMVELRHTRCHLPSHIRQNPY